MTRYLSHSSSHGAGRRCWQGLVALVTLLVWPLMLTLVPVPAAAFSPLELLAPPAKNMAVRTPMSPRTEPSEGADLVIHGRLVMTFRSSLLGASPQVRARRAQARLDELLGQVGALKAGLQTTPIGLAVTVDDAVAFVVTPDDADRLNQESLEAAAGKVVLALETVIQESRESRDYSAMLKAGGRALLATLLGGLLLLFIARILRRLECRLSQLAEAHSQRVHIGGAAIFSREWILGAVRHLLNFSFYLLALLLIYVWVGFMLGQFPYTRAWGEQLTGFLVGVVSQIATGILSTLPDIFVALLIVMLARLCSRLLGNFFDRVQSGQMQVDWLDAELVVPTRRISKTLLWLFALAMAYPYLPGAQTEAFRGLTVLVGLMLSLGASAHVGQVVSGLILTYTRVFRRGEYVKIAEHEGTVVDLGLVSTRIRTGMGEELSLPNSLILANVTKNYSRVVKGAGYIMDATVTIGYDTPWRQVSAMLVEAARRTPGVLADPEPRVFQTRLSDFYPEYRLVCQAIPSQPRPRAEVLDMLHANIQDVFHENNVQIMSPHYLGDPATLKIPPKTD